MNEYLNFPGKELNVLIIQSNNFFKKKKTKPITKDYKFISILLRIFEISKNTKNINRTSSDLLIKKNQNRHIRVGGDRRVGVDRRGGKSYLFIKPTSVLNLNLGQQCSKFIFKKFFKINIFLKFTFRLKLQIFLIRFKI